MSEREWQASDFALLAEYDWVYTGVRPTRLHHLAERSSPDEWVAENWRTEGRASCGLRSTFYIPGLFSRMGMERCKVCCDKLGWPHGVGSPKNDSNLRPLVVERLSAGQSPEPADETNGSADTGSSERDPRAKPNAPND